ncbi:MAG: DHH family phosphoesterase, partial [Schwartzia sp.]|nr:DHH family phosphoesterase [Schwartzia sp. (in: firmicutes)]
MQTGEPIYIREEPVGCTATIVANMYWQKEIEISREVAGLLLSAIISDTVLF